MTKSKPYSERNPYFDIRLEFETKEERDRYKKEFQAAIKKAGYQTGREWLRDKIRDITKA